MAKEFVKSDFVVGQTVVTHSTTEFEIVNIIDKDGQTFLVDWCDNEWLITDIAKTIIQEAVIFDWGNGCLDYTDEEEFAWTCINNKHQYKVVGTFYGRTWKEASANAKIFIEAFDSAKVLA